MKMKFNVNNGGTMEVFQARDDGPVYVTVYEPEKDGKREQRSSDIVQPGDFITIMNWYRYQEEHGNESLNF